MFTGEFVISKVDSKGEGPFVGVLVGMPVDELIEANVGMYTRDFVGTAVVCGRGDGSMV